MNLAVSIVQQASRYDERSSIVPIVNEITSRQTNEVFFLTIDRVRTN